MMVLPPKGLKQKATARTEAMARGSTLLEAFLKSFILDAGNGANRRSLLGDPFSLAAHEGTSAKALDARPLAAMAASL